MLVPFRFTSEGVHLGDVFLLHYAGDAIGPYGVSYLELMFLNLVNLKPGTG
jgi:hypothetical protein